MASFQGDWRNIPEFMNHFKFIQSWIDVHGIDTVFEPTEEFELPEEAENKVEKSQGEIWTKLNLNDGVCLEQGLYESENAMCFILTRNSPLTENQIESLALDCRIACPDCSDLDSEEGEGCEKCEFDGTLFLPYEELGLPF